VLSAALNFRLKRFFALEIAVSEKNQHKIWLNIYLNCAVIFMRKQTKFKDYFDKF